jgi:hypothetical protein
MMAKTEEQFLGRDVFGRLGGVGQDRRGSAAFRGELALHPLGETEKLETDYRPEKCRSFRISVLGGRCSAQVAVAAVLGHDVPI